MAKPSIVNRRDKWLDLMERICVPVLTNISNLPYSSDHEDFDHRASYKLEALGRVVCGIAPWLNNFKTDALAKQYLSITSCAIDSFFEHTPNTTATRQGIIDFGYLCQGFMRCPELWSDISLHTRVTILEFYDDLKQFEPIDNNWLMMTATSDCFFSNKRGVTSSINQVNTWYKGEGVYGDGIHLQHDYYNSLVIHPALVDIGNYSQTRRHDLADDMKHDVLRKRAARYAEVLEHQISPTGTYPAIGRSLTYRFGVFHALSHALAYGYYNRDISKQRAALLGMEAVIDNFEPGMFTDGWVNVGFVGSRLDASESYITSGSVYACALIFAVLALGVNDPIWDANIDNPENWWTNKRAFAGLSFDPGTTISNPEPLFIK